MECHFVFHSNFLLYLPKPLVGWLPCPLKIAVVQVQTIINGETVAKTMVADVRVPSKVVGLMIFVCFISIFEPPKKGSEKQSQAFLILLYMCVVSEK